MELSRERPMHNTIDERIAETGGNFRVEMKILNLIGCMLCPTVTDAKIGLIHTQLLYVAV